MDWATFWSEMEPAAEGVGMLLAAALFAVGLIAGKLAMASLKKWWREKK